VGPPAFVDLRAPGRAGGLPAGSGAPGTGRDLRGGGGGGGASAGSAGPSGVAGLGGPSASASGVSAAALLSGSAGALRPPRVTPGSTAGPRMQSRDPVSALAFGLEAARGEVGATRWPGGVGAPAARVAVDASGNGVWVAKDLWRTVRQQLDNKADELAEIRSRHAQETAALSEALEAARAQATQLQEELFLRGQTAAQREAELSDRVEELGRESALHAEALKAARQEQRDQVEHLMQMLWERDSTQEDATALSRSLDDATFKLKMESHRAEVSSDRVLALEREGAFLKDRLAATAAKLEACEKAEREGAEALTQAQLQLNSYREKLLGERNPDEMVRVANERLEGDCRRLVALLETTSEFGNTRLVESEASAAAPEGDSAAAAVAAATDDDGSAPVAEQSELAGRHFVPLADFLVERGVVKSRYTPAVNDRQDIRLDGESLKWVPRKALEVTREFLGAQCHRLPEQPFMALLLQLNRVWRHHEREQIEQLKRKFEEAQEAMKRRLLNRVSVKDVTQQQKIKYLRKLLTSVNENNGKILKSFQGMTSQAAAQRRRGGEPEDEKVLLEWGLATIQALSKQVSETAEENRQLRKKLYVDTVVPSPPASPQRNANVGPNAAGGSPGRRGGEAAAQQLTSPLQIGRGETGPPGGGGRGGLGNSSSSPSRPFKV